MKKDVYKLTAPQNAIWLTEQYYQNTNINNICGSATITEKVNFENLEKAINIFVKNTDSFRIQLLFENSQIKQYVTEYVPFKIETVKVETEEQVKELEKETGKKIFNLIENKLFEFKLFSLPNGEGGFVINAHHIISDSWTLGIMVNKIIEIYAKLNKNEETENIQILSYIDYIKSEQEYIASEKFIKDKTYWEEKFNSVPEIAEIPSINARNQDTDVAAKRELISINKEELNKINEFCMQNKVSVYNFFMALFDIYVSKVSNLKDFVIGTPILNRTNFKEKNTPGMFISTIPFRITIDSDKTFAEYVFQVAADSIGMLRHQKYSYQYIIENLRKKDPSLPNLYNVMLSYQITKMTANMDEVPHKIDWAFNETMSDDIDIHLFDFDGEELNIAYDYKVNKYCKSDITKMHKRIMHMVDEIISNPSLQIKEIEIVTEEEKNKILNEFNNTKVEYPKDKTVVDLFEEQVEKSPDKIAVVFENEKLTYKELNEKANSLAHYLVEKGVEQGNVVGIMVNRSLEMIVGILAILKSGAAYLPIDPDYPKDRIEYMLEDSKCRFILVKDRTANLIDDNFNKINIELREELYNADNENLNIKIDAESLMYLIYTSGTTGKPKGVMLKHRSISNLINYCNSYVEYLKFNEYRSIVSVTTMSFDIFIFETLISLQKGLRLVVATEEEQTIPRLLNKLIEKENVEIIQTTPSRMQLLINNIGEIPSIKNLKFVTLAGEQLPILLVKELVKIAGCKVYNGYGPSETTVFSTLTDVSFYNKITIGKPLYNTQIYILDENKNMCPIGVPGEIFIAGDGVGKGYINREDLTKEKFVKDIFSKSNQLMYQTGDLGYYDEMGEITCLGRCDNQVKIRGLRIELDEIETLLSKYEGISNCVVVKKNLDGHELLCAYYIQNKEVDISEIRKYLSSKLPKYMVPQHFIKLDEFPYTPNGKIDKKRLPLSLIQEEKKEFVDVRNEVDAILLKELSKLFGSDGISLSSSFFDLGGDSLTAINLCIRLYDILKIQINVKDIIQNPTILDLSNLISAKRQEQNIVIPKVEERKYYPVSSAQRRMYYAASIDGENSILYNIAGGLIIDNKLDKEKLEKCINILINRHESLRTYFDIVDGDIVQKIAPEIEFKLKEENTELEDINEICKNNIKPFDLSKAPLFDTKLINMLNGKSLFLINMHHIISDGASLEILTKELEALYNEEEVIKEKIIDYKDYAVWENNRLKENKYKEDKEYWVKNFEDEIPLLNMPTNYVRPTVQSFEGDSVYQNFSRELTSKINKYAKKLSITPYMFLLSVYYVLLYKYTGQEDIIVGSPIIGREYQELTNILGMFANSLPLRSKIDSKCSFKEFVKKVKENCLKAFEHQAYPFDEIIKELKIKRDTSRNPLFDTMFIYQNNGMVEMNLDGVSAKTFTPESKISKFDLSVEVIPEEEKLNIRFEYCTKLFNKEFIERLSKHYLKIIEEVLDNKEILISKIDMLTEEEKNQIINEFNNTVVDYSKDKTVIELFEEQVEKNPNKIAVVFEDKKLTYKELNEKANALARFMQECSVEDGDIVGIMLDRSLETIISMLAVLKTNSAYMLIDKDLPEDRIVYMLYNASAKLLITSRFVKSVEFKNKVYIGKIDFNDISKENLHLNYNIENSFCIIYTSGSTGLPKGVELKNKGVVNMALSYKHRLNTDICDTFISISTVAFDMFIVENYVPLLSGKTIILTNNEEQKMPNSICDLIERYDVDFILTTPSRIELLLNEEYVKCLSKLKVIQLGGEVFTTNLYNKLSKYTNAYIYNGYGPSEITACCANKNVKDQEMNIGKPFCNTQIYILDNNLNLCPIGIPGEICVAGDGVSKGYINNEITTKKAFIKNPFGFGMLYKTGDIGKYDEKGELEYIGRKDFQVKLRGLRIELSEIEKQLLNIKHIKNCAVVYRGEGENAYLAAFITSTKKHEDISKIREKLSKHLPLYMIPKYIIQLEKMPITRNGKINLKELKQYDISILETENYVAPETELQKLFCKIWEKLLGTKVGIENDVFELGADSLLAIKFKVEALAQNIDVSYADIFKYPTVRELSEANKITIAENLDNYDYTKINKVLEKNKISNVKGINNNINNNVLLLGSNGFVGMHILSEFIKLDKGNIYCIVRDKDNISARDRFLKALHFYFGETFDKYLDKRIIILKGDITKEYFGLDLNIYKEILEKVSIVVNSSANVRHYGNYKNFEDINIGLTQKAIEFCKENNKRLIQISTTSVCGNVEGKEHINFAENNLYIGQALDNVYIKSKYEAERIVLENISYGLDAKILRIGNITNRYSDGEFQVNPDENAFLLRLQSLIKLGVVPEYLLNTKLQFTPVDLLGKAITLCIENNIKDISVLHLFNNNYVEMKEFIKILNDNNVNLNIVSDVEFNKIIRETLLDDTKNNILSGIINDLSINNKIEVEDNLDILSEVSRLYLNKLDFKWEKIDNEYVKKYINYMKNKKMI